jgi:hypothetical protein
MSRVARDWAWALSVAPTQKLVITVLAERANSEGYCFPSLAHLTGMTGLARSTVAAALQEREAARRIVRVRGGGRKSTRYQLLLPESDAVATSPRVGRISAAQACGQCRIQYVVSRGGEGNTCWDCRLYLRHRCRHCGAPLTVRSTGRHREVCTACQRARHRQSFRSWP